MKRLIANLKKRRLKRLDAKRQIFTRNTRVLDSVYELYSYKELMNMFNDKRNEILEINRVLKNKEKETHRSTKHIEKYK